MMNATKHRFLTFDSKFIPKSYRYQPKFSRRDYMETMKQLKYTQTPKKIIESDNECNANDNSIKEPSNIFTFKEDSKILSKLRQNVQSTDTIQKSKTPV